MKLKKKYLLLKMFLICFECIPKLETNEPNEGLKPIMICEEEIPLNDQIIKVKEMVWAYRPGIIHVFKMEYGQAYEIDALEKVLTVPY